MNLLLLSAGLGTRLKPLTQKIPKPALPILNVPMLMWNYYYFKDKPLQNRIVNTFHLEDILKNKTSVYEPRFIYHSDGKEVLGTGGGITHNAGSLKTSDSFWVVNGDGFFLTNPNFVDLAEAHHKKTKALATLVVCDHSEVGNKFGGVWVDSNNKILSIGKARPKEAIKGFHFTGFRILSNAIFKELPSDGPHELFDTLNKCLKKKMAIELIHVNGDFYETGNEDDYLKTNEATLAHLKSGAYSSLIQNILKTYTPNSQLNSEEFLMKLQQADVPKDLFCEEKLRIFEGTKLEGFFISGKNVTVRENCTLTNVVILDNQDIPSNSTYKNQVIF